VTLPLTIEPGRVSLSTMTETLPVAPGSPAGGGAIFLSAGFAA